jgi:hypothetical protein
MCNHKIMVDEINHGEDEIEISAYCEVCGADFFGILHRLEKRRGDDND